MLDSGSQVCLITQRCTNKLNAIQLPSSLTISGINGSPSRVNFKIHPSILSRFGTEVASVDFHVLRIIISNLPTQKFNTVSLSTPNSIQHRLADPHFGMPAPIDLLLGAEVFFQLLIPEKVQVDSHSVFQNTSLGWIFTGMAPVLAADVLYACSSNPSNVSLSCFERSRSIRQSTEEADAEAHFMENVNRNELGRFIVKLPFSKNPAELGNSRSMAIRRFLSLENRLAKNPALAQKYRDFYVRVYSIESHGRSWRI